MSIDCVCCTLECCNGDFREIEYGIKSLSYVQKELEKISFEDDLNRLYLIGLIERMGSQVKRIDTAMKNCGRRVHVPNKESKCIKS